MKKIFFGASRVSFSLSLALLFTVLLGGCAEQRRYDPNAHRAPARDQGFLEHHVEFSGETLSIISQWYTGRTENWRLIADANPGVRPERIRIGDTIMIPRDLVIEDAPLPEGIVRKFRGTQPVAPKKDEKSGDVTDTPPAEPVAAPQDDVTLPPTDAKQAAPVDDLFDSDKPAGDIKPATPPPVVTTPEVPAKDSTPPAKDATKEDKEREKLLDELLSQ